MTKEFKKLFPSFVKQETKDEKALELYYFTDAEMPTALPNVKSLHT